MFRRKPLPKPEMKPLSPSAQIDKDLKIIYGQESGEATDFSKLDVHRSHGGRRLLLWLLATLLILAGAAYGGYLVFERAVSGSGETLTLSVDGPNEVVSGEEVQFDVRFENIGAVPLASLEVKLNVPKGFVIKNTEPAATSEGTIWTMGAMTSGSDGLIRLNGIWTDPVPSDQTLQALATYRPANFNADFQKIATKAVSISGSVLQLTGEGPKTAAGGSSADYVFTIKNTGKQNVDNARVRLTIPPAFIVSATDPAPTEGGGSEWVLSSLAPQAETKIKVSGSFAADSSGLTSLSSSVGLMREQEFLIQAASEVQTDVVGGGLALRLIVNGSTTDQTADPGSTLRLSIDVDNGSSEEVKGLSIVLTSASDSKTSPIDWTHYDSTNGGVSVNTITWDGKYLSKEGVLAAGERETIDLNLPLLHTLGTASDTFTLGVTATVSQVGDVAVNRSLQSTPLTIKVNSDTSLTTDARYFREGVTIGSGPLPPQVGQTTRYRLYWSINNSLHALDDVTVSATIPPGVTYVGSVTNDIGNLLFDPATRLLTWKIDRLPTTITTVGTSFDLSVTPSTDDVGKFIKLLNTTSLTATDSKTQAHIEQESDAQTTELPNDTDAADKGAVIE